MWLELLKQYWRVSTLRATPAETPYSFSVLVFISFIFYLVVCFQWSILSNSLMDLPTALFLGALILGCYYLYTYLVLLVLAKKNRFLQTLNSLLISYLIIHIFAFPLIILTQILSEEEGFGLAFLLVLVVYFIGALILTIWQFLATAHIFRYALDTHFFNGILCCLGLMAFSFIVLSFIR